MGSYGFIVNRLATALINAFLFGLRDPFTLAFTNHYLKEHIGGACKGGMASCYSDAASCTFKVRKRTAYLLQSMHTNSYVILLLTERPGDPGMSEGPHPPSPSGTRKREWDGGLRHGEHGSLIRVSMNATCSP